MITYNDIMDNVYNMNALDEIRDDVRSQVDNLKQFRWDNPDMDKLQRHSIDIAIQVYDAVLERIEAQYELVTKKQSTLIQAQLN
jgi:hypothetical protein